MTILQGQFAILLVVTAPDQTTATSLETALRPVADRFDLVIAVRALKDGWPSGAESDTEDSESLTISVHGADRPGIVHAVAGALAERGGNVVDLSTQLVGGPELQVYVLTLRAVVRGGPCRRCDGQGDAHRFGVGGPLLRAAGRRRRALIDTVALAACR